MSFPIEHFPDANFPEAHFPHEAVEPEPTEGSNSTRNWLSVGPHLALVVGAGLALCLWPLGACHGPGAALEASDPPTDTLERCQPWPQCYDPRPPDPPVSP